MDSYYMPVSYFVSRSRNSKRSHQPNMLVEYTSVFSIANPLLFTQLFISDASYSAVWHGPSYLSRKECRSHDLVQGNTEASRDIRFRITRKSTLLNSSHVR